MSKYITKFELTGISQVNTNKICKDWNDRFSICTWINKDEEKYTFIVHGKRKGVRLCKTEISKAQAMEVVDKLGLVHVGSGFASGGGYHTKEFVKAEATRISDIVKEKEMELGIIRHMLSCYERHL